SLSTSESPANMAAAVHSQTCFICNEQGHFARDCPRRFEDDAQTRRRPQNCYNCGQPDHLARDCPNEQTNERPCFKCQKVGHFARDCPSADSRNCFRCGQPGHLARDCPNDENGKENTNRESPLSSPLEGACFQ
ncbi:hypothetical protein FOZ63_011703, partial [Perkinsus olseni]